MRACGCLVMVAACAVPPVVEAVPDDDPVPTDDGGTPPFLDEVEQCVD